MSSSTHQQTFPFIAHSPVATPPCLNRGGKNTVLKKVAMSKVFRSSLPLPSRFYKRSSTKLSGHLSPGVDINRVNMWYKVSPWIAAFCRTSALLCPSTRDAPYWPLVPQRTVTVWVAIYDVDEGNGAMQVLKGSHRHG